jgi:hypothetical protein
MKTTTKNLMSLSMMMIMKSPIKKEKKNRKSKLGKKQQIKFFDYFCPP